MSTKTAIYKIAKVLTIHIQTERLKTFAKRDRRGRVDFKLRKIIMSFFIFFFFLIIFLKLNDAYSHIYKA